MYEAVWNSSRVAVSLSADPSIMGEGLMGKELSEKPDAIENLTLTVKGNLDNAEPVFVVGGLSNRKTHYFENVVKVENEKLILSDDLKEKISSEYSVALLKSNVFKNQAEIIKELQPKSIVTFFNELKSEVKNYYGV